MLFDTLKKSDHIVVEGKRWPDTLVVSDKTETHVLAYPNGGGFQFRIPESAINNDFSKVSLDEMVPVWEAGEFYYDDEDGDCFKGFHNKDRWNGWACPAFPLEEAKKIMKAQEHIAEDCGRISFDEEADKFSLTYDGETEDFEGFDIKVDGKKVHVYGIGAYSWTWTVR